MDNIIPTVSYFVDRIGSPSWSIIRDKISYHDLTYIYKGKATYLVNGIEYTARPGEVIYIPKGSMREAYTYQDSPMHGYAFNFDCYTPDNDNIELPFPTTFKIGKFSEITGLCKDFNHEWIEKNPGYKLKTRALFMQILHKLLTLMYYNNPNLTIDSRIITIREYIINHYFEEIEIEQLAGMINLHPIYLGTLFKKRTGFSIKEYITKIRVNSAESLLSMGGCTVGEAAVRCGFEDIYYFSKVYKKCKGYPPSHSINIK